MNKLSDKTTCHWPAVRNPALEKELRRLSTQASLFFQAFNYYLKLPKEECISLLKNESFRSVFLALANFEGKVNYYLEYIAKSPAPTKSHENGDDQSGVNPGSAEWCVQVCRNLHIPLPLGENGKLVIDGPSLEYFRTLKDALYIHSITIATIIANQRANLADATEYIDSEFPCDYAAMDADSGELTASCATKTHSEEEITERWAEIANAVRNEGEPN